jgi:hypothetical protein
MSEELQAPVPPAEPQQVDVAALQRSIEALERKNYELVGKLQKAKTIPDDVDVEGLIKFKREHEQAKLESQGQYTEARQQLQDQYDRDTGTLKARIAELEHRIRELELITPATKVLSDVLHDPDYLFAKGILKPEQIETGVDGPMFVDGLKRVPLAEYALEVSPAYLRKAPRPQGSGAPTGGGLTVTSADPFLKFFLPASKGGDYNLTEQNRIYQTDPGRYQQLKELAKGA